MKKYKICKMEIKQKKKEITQKNRKMPIHKFNKIQKQLNQLEMKIWKIIRMKEQETRKKEKKEKKAINQIEILTKYKNQRKTNQMQSNLRIVKQMNVISVKTKMKQTSKNKIFYWHHEVHLKISMVKQITNLQHKK